jgi:hypothetical protein
MVVVGEKTKEQILYQPTDIGPYKVNFMNKKDAFLDTMGIAQKLSNLGYHDVANVQRNSRKVVTFQFSSLKSANNVLSDVKLNELYEIYIPKSFVCVFGFVKGLGSDIVWEGDNGLIETLKSKNPSLIEVKRLTYKDNEGNEQQSYKTALTFRAKKLPEFIFAYGVRKRVFPSVNRVRLCENCGRFGHLKIKCKSKKKHCPACFSTDHENCETISCKHCKAAHKTGDPSCNEFDKQKKINKIMAYENVGFNEARKKLSPNKFAVLEDNSEFPSMPVVSYANATKTNPQSSMKRNYTSVRTNNRLNPRERAEATPIIKKGNGERIINPLFGKSYLLDFSALASSLRIEGEEVDKLLLQVKDYVEERMKRLVKTDNSSAVTANATNESSDSEIPKKKATLRSVQQMDTQ